MKSHRIAWPGVSGDSALFLTERFYEPCYESGRAVRTSIYRSDRQPTAITSIWERIIDQETGEVLMSFSMLTVNADDHSLMKRFHKPEDEKRSVVVVENNYFMDWLHATNEQAKDMLKLSLDGCLEADFLMHRQACFRISFNLILGIRNENC